MDREYKSDFEFKDDRQYVHSSTLVEEFTTLINSRICFGEHWDQPKLDARFHKEINNNGIFTFSENKALHIENRSASASFTFYDNKKKFYAVINENEDDNIFRRVKTNYKVDKIELNEKFCGSCKIDCQTQKAFIENTVEANKRIHLETLNDPGKKLRVANMYIRRLPVYFSNDKKNDLRETVLQVTNISCRNQNETILTLNSLSFPEEDIESFEMAFIVY